MGSIDRTHNKSAQIINCCNMGNVTCTTETLEYLAGGVGGISGYYASIKNCYNMGGLKGCEGQKVHYISDYTVGISDCYAIVGSNLYTVDKNTHDINEEDATDIPNQALIAGLLNENIKKYTNIDGLVNWIDVDDEYTIPDIEVDQTELNAKTPIEKVGNVEDQICIGNGKVEFKDLEKAKYVIKQVQAYKLNTDTNEWEALIPNKDYTTKDMGSQITNDVSESEKIEGVIGNFKYAYYPLGYPAAKEMGISNCNLIISGMVDINKDEENKSQTIPAEIGIQGYGTFEVNGIADNAFEGKNQPVEKLYLPDTIVYIGKKVFSGWYNLHELYIPFTAYTQNTISNLGGNVVQNDAFEDASRTLKIYGPEKEFSDVAYSAAKEHGVEYLESEMLDGILYVLDGNKLKAMKICMNTIGESAYADTKNVWYSKTWRDELKLPGYRNKYDYFRQYKLTEIAGDCFSDVPVKNVELSNTVEKIDSKAFKNCKTLETILIPRGTTSISFDAFDGIDNLTIRGYANSYAEEFARSQDINFEVIEDDVKVHDLTEDKKIDINDITVIFRYIKSRQGGIYEDYGDVWNLSPEQLEIADVNKDGLINDDDISRLQLYIAARSNDKIAESHPDWLDLSM